MVIKSGSNNGVEISATVRRLSENRKPTRLPPPYYSLAAVSAAALAYEILLLKLFSIAQWHHFAHMIISLALLGYGASGTFLSLARKQLLSRFEVLYVGNIATFGISATLCFIWVNQISFNPQELVWDPRQWGILLGIYCLLSVPFFFAANAIGLALCQYQKRVSMVYGADLVGAGLGSLAIVLALYILFPGHALRCVSAAGILAAALAWHELRLSPGAVKWLIVLAAAIPLNIPGDWTQATMSPYKSLSQSLRVAGARIIDTRTSPLGLISVLENDTVPLRHTPGLSLNATLEPPPQLGIFTDGDGPTVINQGGEHNPKIAYLDQITSTLPYHLAEPGRVLILGAGGGSQVLQARYHHAKRIDAVEINPQVVDLVANTYADYAGRIYGENNVAVHTGEAREFMSNQNEPYDLVQITLLDSFSASSAGLYALNEGYIYTLEAFDLYLRQLNPGGFLVITRWIKIPPRDSLKLFATALEALRRSGVDNPEHRLILIRGWQTSTLVVKNGVLTQKEIDRTRRFCLSRSFDTSYFPGISAQQTNQFNILNSDLFFLGTQALISTEANDFLQKYAFNIRPATDNQPYFFHFLKWQKLSEIIAIRERGGAALLESGYLALVATVIQAALTSFLLIVLPMLLGPKVFRDRPFRQRSGILIYFAALGLAFIFIEIALIQKFILFLHHPVFSVTAVLTSMLIFAGLGSGCSSRLTAFASTWGTRGIATLVILFLSSVYIATMDALLDPLLTLPYFAKVVCTVLIIAPLAFFMGMPFPLGLQSVGQKNAAVIPWVWGINGCASVFSAAVSSLIAIEFGFTNLIFLALFLYFIALLVFPWLDA